MISRLRKSALAIGILAALTDAASSQQTDGASPCISVLHDEVGGEKQGKGPIYAVFLANLLGHWPSYEVRVSPIGDYRSGMTEECKATLYIGADTETAIPTAFLEDFLETARAVTWIGFGTDKLDQERFSEIFGHRANGLIDADNKKSSDPGFFHKVLYKGSSFKQKVSVVNGVPYAEFSAVRYSPTKSIETAEILANLVHNKTLESVPYFLRSGNRFVVADNPFSYMHEGSRYFAFADLLFDILDEAPRRTTPFAFARIEDIHAFVDQDALKAAISTLTDENVPVSMAHIPLFMDPHNAFGGGARPKPVDAATQPEITAVLTHLLRDDRNTLIWHGSTHQLGSGKNPYSGTSGDDYEFWDAVHDRAVKGDSVKFTLGRLEMGIGTFEKFGAAPRFWVTPHYRGSAISSRVFGRVFPWVIGRVTYYPTSFGTRFTLKAVDPSDDSATKTVSRKKLAQVAQETFDNLDRRSGDGQGQLMPFEIYRDVYGQRIVPETLDYITTETNEQSPWVRTVEMLLADAKRNLVVRDYWASFFFHPYILEAKGKPGKYDTSKLRHLITGLKELGYSFVSLPEFERSVFPDRESSAKSGDEER